MNFKRIFTLAGLVFGGTIALATTPAQATNFNFSTFNFRTTVSGNVGGNQMLEEVFVVGRRYSKNEMALVNGVRMIQNDVWTGRNTGAASADLGVGATVGVKDETGSAANITRALGNLNLNSIVDTEDTGSFTMEVTFAQAAQNFLFWERGRNSRLMVEALNATGGVIGRYLLDSRNHNLVQDAGFRIQTTEIASSQAVGALGLRLNQATNRLRLISTRQYQGADFKVMAAVPEPMTITGTALAAGALIATRRKKRKQALNA